MNVATTPFEPPRVLVTDDDYDERFATARVLEREGFSVDQAKTGLEAIAKAEQFMPDIILLDVVMPAPDGFEVCRRIKSEKRFEEISVVMLSNYNNTPEYKAKGLDVGADDFISRPYNRKEFIARINSLLRVKRIEKQLRLQQQWMHVTLTSIGDGL
ncbi:MAG: response regulator, partial [Desulfobacteraceae bacterium]